MHVHNSESVDDPHDFDRDPLAFLRGPGAAQAQAAGSGGAGGGQYGDASGGPFAALLQQLLRSNGLVVAPQSQSHPQAHAAPHQEPAAALSPGEAAARAAESRATGSRDPSAAVAGTQAHGAGTRSNGATFIWSDSDRDRDPPSVFPSPPAETETEQHQGPVRNLASFLQEAFQGPPPSSSAAPRRPEPATSPLQEGPARHADGGGGGAGLDPLTGFLSRLAGGLQQQGRGPPGAQRQDHDQGQAARQAGRHGVTTITFGNPAGGSGGRVMTFTFGGGDGTGTGDGAQAQGQHGDGMMGMGGLPFLPFLMGGAGGGNGNGGQLGDYVFSQGALDK